MSALTTPAPIRIDPAAVYTIAAVVLTLDVPSATIRAAIRSGHLPAVRRGHRHYITGADLLRWLTPATRTEGRANG
jgi:hypothetical protein